MTQGLSAVRLERMHTVLGGYIDRGELRGLVTFVSRGEDVEGALSFGGAPTNSDTIFRIGSMTKPITAAAAMILVEECRRRLDDPVDATPKRARNALQAIALCSSSRCRKA
jgi:CubicO group peptidase (beta-lactamase class C family)